MTEESLLAFHLKGVQTIVDLRSLLLKSEILSNCNALCADCGTELAKGNNLSEEVVLNLHSGPSHSDDVTVTLLECRTCSKYVAVWCSGHWCSIENFLQLEEYSQTEFSVVKSPVDHLILFLLSQICHNQRDIDLSAGESPFLPPGRLDYSILMWKNNYAVGFYTIKQKGSAYPGYPLSRYNLNMVDAIYVRRSWRHQGIASRAIAEVFSKFPDQNVGFSDPISQSLIGVLCSCLSDCPDLRDHIWVCSYTGEPGYRWNVYLRMKKEVGRKRKA